MAYGLWFTNSNCLYIYISGIDPSAEFFWPYWPANCFFPADFRLAEFFTADFRRIQNSAAFRLIFG